MNNIEPYMNNIEPYMNNIESFKIGSPHLPSHLDTEELEHNLQLMHGTPPPQGPIESRHFFEPLTIDNRNLLLGSPSYASRTSQINWGQAHFCINVDENLINSHGIPQITRHSNDQDPFTGRIPGSGSRSQWASPEFIEEVNMMFVNAMPELDESESECEVLGLGLGAGGPAVPVCDAEIYWREAGGRDAVSFRDIRERYISQQLGLGGPGYWMTLSENHSNRLCFERDSNEWKCAYLDGGFNSTPMTLSNCLQECLDNEHCRSWEFDNSNNDQDGNGEDIGKCTLFNKEPGLWSQSPVEGTDGHRCYFPSYWEEIPAYTERINTFIEQHNTRVSEQVTPLTPAHAEWDPPDSYVMLFPGLDALNQEYDLVTAEEARASPGHQTVDANASFADAISPLASVAGAVVGVSVDTDPDVSVSTDPEVDRVMEANPALSANVATASQPEQVTCAVAESRCITTPGYLRDGGACASAQDSIRLQMTVSSSQDTDYQAICEGVGSCTWNAGDNSCIVTNQDAECSLASSSSDECAQAGASPGDCMYSTEYDCSNNAKGLDVNPESIICPFGVCTPQDCCTIQRTCSDTNASGTPGPEFDCSGSINSLVGDPVSTFCSGNECTVEECCTVPPRTCGDIDRTGTAGGTEFDCSGTTWELDPNPNSIICNSDPNECTAQECCTVVPITCIDLNGNGVQGDEFDCSQHTNSLDLTPWNVVCSDIGCSADECCTVPPTCANINADGNNINFDCSQHPNGLDLNPEDVICSSTGCSSSECCTVERTCANINADGTNINFNCIGNSNSLDLNPEGVVCSSTDCTSLECCTIPRPLTCEDTNQDGTNINFVCTDHSNSLNLNPGDVVCSSPGGCTADECCTVPPFTPSSTPSSTSTTDKKNIKIIISIISSSLISFIVFMIFLIIIGIVIMYM